MLRSSLVPLTVLMLSALLLASCATLFNDDSRSVMVTSSPSGAEITINGNAHGVTPMKISVNDHERLSVTIRKAGFHPAGCYINTSVEAIWVILDVALFFAVVPLVVDLVTGDWSSLKSEFCSVNLLPMSES
tara:strand:- start:83716 stop:84111 length:396 start_codon:yes stop_codon:yes gene_type:complete